MCGIFGLSLRKSSGADHAKIASIIETLFILSESRGKEAAGLAIDNGRAIEVFKDATAASMFIKRPRYRRFFERATRWPDADSRHLVIMGHSRLVTNGVQGVNENNQPVVAEGIVGIHNGIIVNDAELWANRPEFKRRSDVDTEVLLVIVRQHLAAGLDLPAALKASFAEIDGAASVALVFNDLEALALATNNGSHYYCYDAQSGALVFSSERLILQGLFDRIDMKPMFANPVIQHLKPNDALVQSLESGAVTALRLDEQAAAPSGRTSFARKPSLLKIVDESAKVEEARAAMKRCTRCILPETFPFIEYDAQGVCNICRNYQKIEPLGLDALQERIAPYRKKKSDDSPDCIVSISGGRDSSFGLHYIKRELGLNPVTYTYDWGLVTDLARRNISRLCGRLGVEHLLISADIRRKRANVRRNVTAWLRNPELGMIPLFMAGDKQYFYHGHDLAKKTGTKLVFFFPNRLERTNFKSGFCGIDEGNKWFFKISLADKAKLAFYFGKEFLKNPTYLNPSLLDSAHAFYSTYFLPNDDFLFMFDYVPWKEEVIVDTLREHYDWEMASDTKSTWRIGDGTAAFYNYIYYTAAGFTEHDTFRSNQVREGIITRDQALAMALSENQPRYETFRQYSQVIGFDCDYAMQVINAMPKLYLRES